MKIDNGTRLPLVISEVFDGIAGVSSGFVSFIPNRSGDPSKGFTGVLDGAVIRLAPTKDKTGPFWTSRFEPV